MALTKKDWFSVGMAVVIALILAPLGYLANGVIGAWFMAGIGMLALLGIHFLGNKPKADIFLYVLGALMFIPGLFYALTGRPILSPPPHPITSANIEELVKQWLDEGSYGPIPRAPDKGDAFSFEGRLGVDPEQHILIVSMTTQKGTKFLQVWTRTNLTEGYQAQLRKLQRFHADDFSKLTRTVQTQTAQLGFEYWPNETPLEPWTIKKSVRIHEGMEDSFLETCQHLQLAALAIEQTISTVLDAQRN